MKNEKLKSENYYNPEMAHKYCGYSQYKDFFGTGKYKGCEAKAMAILKGEWVEEPTPAMTVGSYADSFWDNTQEEWIEQHKDTVYNTRGKKYVDFEKADNALERCSRDKLFCQFMGGEHQKVMTANFFGLDWKIRMDSYNEGICIVDFKYIADLSEKKFVPDFGKVSWVEYYGYDIQGAIYQKVVEINTGKKLPYFLCAVDKGKEPDIEIIQIPDTILSDTLSLIEYNAPRYKAVKYDGAEPDRCECCDYCKHTKVLQHPIGLDELMMKI